MVRIPPNLNDPNGYYAELGLPPWASHDDIRRRVRRLLSTYHPDGAEPDTEKFLRYGEIAEVLTNPVSKTQYDSLPKGKAWIDSRIQSLVSEGLAVTVEKKQDDETAPEKHFDWFAVSPCRYDISVVQRWYVALVAIAPMFDYTRPIKVLLHDEEPRWLDEASILMIPRSWEPTPANAFALFAVKVSPHSLSL